jgi:hypothetical protein
MTMERGQTKKQPPEKEEEEEEENDDAVGRAGQWGVLLGITPASVQRFPLHQGPRSAKTHSATERKSAGKNPHHGPVR